MLACINFRAAVDVLYIESVATTCIVYGDQVPFVDRELQNEREKNDISRLKALYRNLQVKNLENPAKTKQVGSLCHVESK